MTRPPLADQRVDRALPLLAGVLLALSYPPASLLLPPFIGLVPLLVWVHRQPPGPRGRWAATRAGLATGVVYYGLQLYWMAVALLRQPLLAVPAWLGAVLVLAALCGGFAWAVHYGLHRARLPLWVLAPVFWTTLEWVQAHLGDLAFPWLGLGTALAPYPTLAGAADLVGARGLTFWIAAVNGLIASAVVARGTGGARARRAAQGLALVGLVGLPIAYGVWRMRTLELEPVARVALMQPNIPEDVKLDKDLALDSSLVALSHLTRRVRDADGRPADIVLWPEVALPVPLVPGDSLARRVRSLSGAAGAPILAGAYGIDGEGDDARLFNSVFYIDQAGLVGPRYDKRRLVPFVERVPFLGHAVHGRFGGLRRGDTDNLLRTPGGARFGVLICYESIFAGLARDYRARGADFIVNVTNDAWFAGDAGLQRTTALWQHPSHLVLRAIETRTGIARAANTGFSLFVDPLGRTYGRTSLSRPALRIGQVYTTDELTLFVRWGDWLGQLAVVLAGAILVAGWSRGRGGLTGED